MQEAAANIARIDPAQCRLPPTRMPIRPNTGAELIASIRAHGQFVPGLGRGARRHGAATAEILDNLCGVEKGWLLPTLSDMTTKIPPQPRAA